MRRLSRYAFSIFVAVLLTFSVWRVVEFINSLDNGAWTDQYPNKTALLSQAVRAGPGTYDLFSVYDDISAICISFAGVDPRQLAANLLNKDLITLQGKQPFFTLEGVVSIIVFDGKNQFRIEEFDRHELFFTVGPIRENTCVDHPSIARLVVVASRNEFTFAKLTATIDLR